MKKIIFFSAIIISLVFTAIAQENTMYVMKNGKVVGKYILNSEVDSLILYQPKTHTGNTFSDSRDGNVYKTVAIGNQIWMAENLKYLPSVMSPGTSSVTTSCYYVYGYDGISVNDAKTTTNYKTYGVLYNWHAAMNGATSSTSNPSGVQGACPAGWHVPSDSEWTELADFLGSESVAGGKLKESGTENWYSPNTDATNQSGFTALPGGNRVIDGTFYGIKNYGVWWSATEFYSFDSWNRSLGYNFSNLSRGSHEKELGYSIRCIKN